MGKRSTHREPSVEPEQLFGAVDEDGTGDGAKAEDGAQRKHRKFKQNWRLNMLSEPKVLTHKYVTPEWKLVTGVPTDALHAECTERTDHLAISGIRHLKDNKILFTPLRGPNYGKRMDNYIDKSWNSIYNYYRKSLHDLQKRKAEHRKTRRMWSASAAERKGRKGKGKERYKGTKIGKKDSKCSDKSKETMMKEREQWCVERSKPKAVAQPPPVDRGPICDLDLVKQRQDEIATPKRVYRTASKETNYKDPTKVPPAALTYVATERILRIAISPPHKLQKTEEIIPGSVKPAALTYNSKIYATIYLDITAILCLFNNMCEHNLKFAFVLNKMCGRNPILTFLTCILIHTSDITANLFVLNILCGYNVNYMFSTFVLINMCEHNRKFVFVLNNMCDYNLNLMYATFVLNNMLTERITLLAIPKPATIARESDLNEDAFIISPAALKYVATPRILDLAKPKEYSF